MKNIFGVMTTVACEVALAAADIDYIIEHIPDGELRTSFTSLPKVKQLAGQSASE